jgi:hypothetical protein
MGADLCGYIFVGPYKIDPKKYARAKKELEILAHNARVVKEALKAKGKDDEVSIDDFPKSMHGLAAEIADNNGEDWDGVAGAIAAAVETLDEFVRLWEDEGYRDMMSRSTPFPGKRWAKILVSGERTWGDGPDHDSAWGISDRASRLGIPGLLGID